MDFSESSMDTALVALGELLESRDLRYRLAIVGGGGLLLAGLLTRPTADLDIVAQIDDSGPVQASPLPAELAEAVKDVARTLGLPDDWLNPGPAALLDLQLPPGFGDRVAIRRYGSLELHVADRFDQVHFKLYAAVDQGPRSKHFADLRALEPNGEELLAAAAWARTHDPSDAFRTELVAALQSLGLEVGDDSL